MTTEEYSAETPTYVVKPSKGWVALHLKDVWQYRELFYFLTWRDIKVRYKQTILGATWAILQPFLTMVVFSIFFGAIAGLKSDNIPYPIFSYSALVIWYFFANGVSGAAGSMVSEGNTIKKVYFPRLVIPLSSILSGGLDFLLAFVVLIGMMAWYHIAPTINVLWLPLFFLLALITALGVGLWLAAMNVMFRDVRYAVPFMIQIWLFATPIVYSSSELHGAWKTLYGLNPMAGVVDGFRWALLGTPKPGPMIWVSAGVAIVVFVTGMYYFRRTEKSFADVM